MNFKELWNSQADHQNQWDSLGEDEKLEFVAAHEREECAKLCEKQIEKENRLKTGDDQTLSNLLIGHRVTAHMTDARLIRARSKACFLAAGEKSGDTK